MATQWLLVNNVLTILHPTTLHLPLILHHAPANLDKQVLQVFWHLIQHWQLGPVSGINPGKLWQAVQAHLQQHQWLKFGMGTWWHQQGGLIDWEISSTGAGVCTSVLECKFSVLSASRFKSGACSTSEWALMHSTSVGRVCGSGNDLDIVEGGTEVVPAPRQSPWNIESRPGFLSASTWTCTMSSSSSCESGARRKCGNVEKLWCSSIAGASEWLVCPDFLISSCL